MPQMPNPLPTAAPDDTELFEFEGVDFAYSRKTGVFYRYYQRRKCWMQAKPGNSSGYTKTTLHSKNVYIHRIIAKHFLCAALSPEDFENIHVVHRAPVNFTASQDRLDNLKLIKLGTGK